MKIRKNLTVALGCVIRDNKVLLVKRSEIEQPDIHDMWELPGGKVEKENPAMAAIREIREETGYEAFIKNENPFTYTTYWEYNDFFLETVLLCYECEIKSENPNIENFERYDRKIGKRKWIDLLNVDFSRTLPGSREFIWWIAERNSISLRIDDQFSIPSIIQFINIDTKQKNKKYYNIEIAMVKEKGTKYIVKRTWGKIKTFSPRCITKEFNSDPEMRKYLLPILNIRIEQGYLISNYTGNFQMKTWLKTNKDKIYFDKIQVQGKITDSWCEKNK